MLKLKMMLCVMTVELSSVARRHVLGISALIHLAHPSPKALQADINTRCNCAITSPCPCEKS